MNEKTRRVALLGVLFALAMALSFFEGALAPLLGLPPGVKPGLANVVVMYALFWLSWRDALALTVLKSGFVFLVQGASAALLSACGGVCALAAMALVRRLGGTVWMQSASGAIAHNFGQLAAVSLWFMQSAYTLAYAPVLLVSGLCMGSLTAAVLRAAAPAFDRLWKHKKNK